MNRIQLFLFVLFIALFLVLFCTNYSFGHAAEIGESGWIFQEIYGAKSEMPGRASHNTSIFGKPIGESVRTSFSNPTICEIPVRIMPLGNSITKGTGTCQDPDPYWNCTGYRDYLWHLLVDSGYHFDFVGSQGGDYQYQYTHDNNHEGHGSYSTDMIRDNLYGNGGNWLENYPPDVILLHTGTNDIEWQDTAGIITELEQLLDLIDQFELDFSTEVTVVLARITNFSDPNSEGGLKVTQFNNELQVLANARIATGDKLIVVDMENALSYPDDLGDVAHPNATGYEKMAGVWKEALDVILSCAVDDVVIVDEDSGTTTFSVLENDLGSLLSITEIIPGSAGGKITSDGYVVYYQPTNNFFGTETFSYIINNGLPPEGMKQASVSVTVQPINDPPNAIPDSYFLLADGTKYKLDVLNNDNNPDIGEELIIESYTPGSALGTIQITPDWKYLHYKPADEFTLRDVFAYTISDGNGYSDSAQVEINLVSFPGTQINHEKDIVSLMIRTTDHDGAQYNFMASNLPPGLHINNRTGWITGIIQPGSLGEYDVEIIVSDGHTGHQLDFTVEWYILEPSLFFPMSFQQQ